MKIACHHCGQKINVSGFEPFSSINCPACENVLIIPKFFGNYVLEELVSSGSLVTDYRTLDPTLQREVLVRILQENYSADEETSALFLDGVRLASLVNDPHVVTVFSIGEADGRHYAVTEFSSCGGLDEYLSHRGEHQFTPGQAFSIISDVIQGLKAVHRAGYVYGDLAPSDIVINEDFEIKLCDVGMRPLRHKVGVKHKERWPRHLYESPELRQGEALTEASDVYCLGIIFHQLLLGKLPEYQETEAGGYALVEPCSFSGKISNSANALLLKMLELRSEDRYSSIAAVEEALKGVSLTNKTVKRFTMNVDAAALSSYSATQRKKSSAASAGVVWFAIGVIMILTLVTALVLLSAGNGTAQAQSLRADFTSNFALKQAPAVEQATTEVSQEVVVPPGIKKYRPQPEGLDFKQALPKLRAYLKAIKDPNIQQVEKDRIQELNLCRKELTKLLVKRPYQPAQEIKIKARHPSGKKYLLTGYALTTNTDELLLQRHEEPTTIHLKWHQVPIAQFVSILYYYADIRVGFAETVYFFDPANPSKRELDMKKDMELAAASFCFRTALLCDWYHNPEKAKKYAKLCWKFDTEYRAKLKKYLPEMFQ